ncbi:MAG: O-methyltransferase [Actinomycetota bacterium]
MSKGIGLSEELQSYIVAHGTPPDPVLTRLAQTTRELTGRAAGMQIAPEQGAFLTWLTRTLGVRRAVEIGTFTGYSAICIARGLPEDGSLLCLDISEQWTAIGREAWQEAGVADRIELRVGPAAESLAATPAEAQFDLAFIDADKTGYETYLDLVFERLRAGGVVLVDNVLQRGRVLDEHVESDDTRAIIAFNTARTTDDRWDTAMLPVADGLTFLRKR